MHAITYSYFDNLFNSTGNFDINFYDPFKAINENIYLMNKNNVLMSNRKLGDEFAYVLNRKGNFI